MSNVLKIFYNEINSITKKMIEHGISIDQNFPLMKNNEITWQNSKNFNIALKNKDYRDIYKVFEKERNFNIKMIDGALIQINYILKRNKIIKSRLAYFPSPNLERYEDDIEGYENYYFGEGVYSDLIDKYIITTPIRFDFNSDEEAYINDKHPYSHIHFGQIENCRIPINSPITPNIFFKFLLKNFYNKIYLEHFDDYNFSTSYNILNKTISKKESLTLHLNYESI
jgi:hypothetical protein